MPSNQSGGEGRGERHPLADGRTTEANESVPSASEIKLIRAR